MATLVFDIETTALPLELFDEAQQEYLFRETEKIDDAIHKDRGEAGPVEFVPRADESELLTAFWDVAKHYDNIVTFNGRGFDVPFIYLRSALRNVPISRKNWLCYRYDTGPHCDPAE